MKCQLKYLICSLNLTILISVLAPINSLAQDNSSVVNFNGSNVLSGQFSNRQGTNSQLPQSFLRNDLQMTLTIQGIPVATRFFITTEDSAFMQMIDNLSFYIDLNALKRNKARIEANNKAKKPKDKEKISGMLRFLSNFSKIEAGRFRPDYGDLTLSGVPVSGLNIEFTGKHNKNSGLYAALATGRVKRATDNGITSDIAYNQRLIFGKLGYGKKRYTHGYLTYMHMEDEEPDTMQGSENRDTIRKPRSNDLVVLDFRLSFFDNKWIIDGEGGFSVLTRDTRVQIPFYSQEVMAKYVPDAMDPNASTSYDWAYSLKTKLNLKTTTFSGGYFLVRPGYYTLGNPNLVNDRETIEGRIDQAFAKRKVSISAFFKRYKDNLNGWKHGTTISNFYGFIAQLTFPKAPYLQISFTPSRQKTSGDNLYSGDSLSIEDSSYSFSIWNKMNIYTLSTGYNYSIRNLRLFTRISYFRQNTDYERDETINKYSNTQTINLNQRLTFKSPLGLNFNASYTTMTRSDYNRNTISIVFSGTHKFKDKWKNALGVKYSKSSGTYDEYKINIYWDTQIINLWKGADFGLRFNKNIFKNRSNDDKNYNEFLVHGKLTQKW